MAFLQWLKNFGGVVALAAMVMPAARAQIPELAANGITLSIQRNGITVSGISSGAAMAHQLHIAHSNDIAGVGLVAGPPFRCADYLKGNTTTPFTSEVVAITMCTAYYKKLGFGNPIAVFGGMPIKLSRLQVLANEAFQSGGVDPKSGLCGDRVFLIAGGKDDTVPANVTQATRELYEWLLGACGGGVPIEQLLKEVKLRDMPHTMPTDSLLDGQNCPPGAPFIADCDFQGADYILKFLYPAKAAAPQANRPASRENLFNFDQHQVIGAFEPKGMMHKNGYIYVPDACQHGETCPLHVAFHGCRQNEDQINAESNNLSKEYLFAADAGYNEFAERNNLVVLYPQVDNTSQLGENPAGCWDWWGYTEPVFYQQGARQIQNIWKIVGEVARVRQQIGERGAPKGSSRGFRATPADR
jgi:poly(3-hydroxybutyrate) depolymerase